MTPGFWMYETSGMLRPAVEAYLNHAPMTPEQIAAMRAYLRQWIKNGDWRGGMALDNLYFGIDQLDSREKIHAWLELADQIGIDPL